MQAGSGEVPAQAIPVDDELIQQMERLTQEAAQQVTFHRGEASRWQRVGRAAANALQQLNMGEPHAVVSPEDFFSDQRKNVNAPGMVG